MTTQSLNSTSKGRSPATFFLILLALYVPLWFIGLATYKVKLLLGISLLDLIDFTPGAAALILAYRENKTAGMSDLLKKLFDYKQIKSKIWYLPMVFLYPLIGLVQYLVSRLSGMQVPVPQISAGVFLMFVIFFIEALVGEELGWMGYAVDPMQERFGALKAALLLGCAWAAFHIPLFALNKNLSLFWIAWQCVYIVAGRVLFVWVYNNAGKSLFSVSLMHVTFNGVWQLFPSSGDMVVPSFYDPRMLAYLAITVAVVVTSIWGPKTLADYKFARSSENPVRDKYQQMAVDES